MVQSINWRTILILSSFIIFGCSSSPQISTTNKSASILFITNSFKFNDIGFIRYNNNDVSLELFNAGHLLFRFHTSKNNVCIDKDCYSKASIIRKFFGDDLFIELDFRKVLIGDVIFNGESLKQNNNGFSQTIKRNNRELIYEVNDKNILLKDKDYKFVLEIEYLQ